MRIWILDTSFLLSGRDLPPGKWFTTPEADAEIQPGGATGRRYFALRERGLDLRSAQPDTWDQVRRVAEAAGNLARLSAPDLSLLALAKETGGTLVTQDFTMLDIAKRMGIAWEAVEGKGIHESKAFQPRCTGCGRWYDAMPKGEECPTCGSPVRSKPRRPARG